MDGPRVALVLAGGGVAGYGFHTGALTALEAATGWDPRTAELIVGTSSGSIVASILRAGVDVGELRERVMVEGPGSEADDPLEALLGRESFRVPRVWRGPAAPRLVASELRRGRRVRLSNLLVGGLPEGRVPTTPLRAVIDSFHPTGWPTAPLWITATDRDSGSRAVFGRRPAGSGRRGGVSVAAAVQASCAVPGYFAPVDIDGATYIDGGMRSPDNADLLVGAGFDVVVISSPLSIDRFRVRRSPAVSLIRAYPRRQLGRNVAALRADGVEVLVVQPDSELAKAIGLNAMSRAKLRPVVTASASTIGHHLARLDGSGDRDPARRARDLLAS